MLTKIHSSMRLLFVSVPEESSFGVGSVLAVVFLDSCDLSIMSVMFGS